MKMPEIKQKEPSLNDKFIHYTDKPVIVGIDEAGRGPVIGPLVYGLYITSPSEVTAFKDSKLLTPKQRESFFNQIQAKASSDSTIGFGYYRIDPSYITTQMEMRTKTLNEISREAVVKLLTVVKERCRNVQTVYIDGLGNNSEYKAYLGRIFNFNFVIENKADSKYQVVSGASIVAKVTRDHCIEGYNCGSGYPADPITKEWLKNNLKPFVGYPDFVRHSWATVKEILGKKKSQRLNNKLDGFYTGPE